MPREALGSECGRGCKRGAGCLQPWSPGPGPSLWDPTPSVQGPRASGEGGQACAQVACWVGPSSEPRPDQTRWVPRLPLPWPHVRIARNWERILGGEGLWCLGPSGRCHCGWRCGPALWEGLLMGSHGPGRVPAAWTDGVTTEDSQAAGAEGRRAGHWVPVGLGPRAPLSSCQPAAAGGEIGDLASQSSQAVGAGSWLRGQRSPGPLPGD